MTARQAAKIGHGALHTNLRVAKVYSLCLEGGGNIITNAAVHPQAAPILITAATMGCRFKPAVDLQHKGSLTYPTNIRFRLGQISGMKSGFKHFKVNEVETRSNGEIIFKTIPTTKIVPPIPNENRPETPLRPSIHDTTTPQKRVLAPKTTVQLESATAIEMDRTEKKGELKTRPIGPPDTTHSDITTCQRPPEELLYERDATKEDLPKPSLTPDTYILIRNGDKASWIQLWTAAKGAIVVQSLPSGNIEDLLGAMETTIEIVCSYEGPTGGFDLVKMGKACVTAHHHIKSEDGWMTAHQAAERGHGTLLTHHAYPKLFDLRLNGGGNIIINTSATLDKTPTQIEAATMGYRLEVSAEPQHDGFITYLLHEGSSGEYRTSQDKPSYCYVVQRHLKNMPGWPTPPVTPSVPKIAQLESNTVTERAKREKNDELKKGPIGLPSTSQRILERDIDSRRSMVASIQPRLPRTRRDPCNPRPQKHAVHTFLTWPLALAYRPLYRRGYGFP